MANRKYLLLVVKDLRSPVFPPNDSTLVGFFTYKWERSYGAKWCLMLKGCLQPFSMRQMSQPYENLHLPNNSPEVSK